MTYFTKDIVYFVCTLIELKSKKCTHFRVEEVRVQLKGSGKPVKSAFESNI